MRGKSSCRKHNIYSRQPPEQHKTKTRKKHECKWLQKHRRHTETNKHLSIKGKMGIVLDTCSWREALISALFKKRDTRLASNYSPVRITSILCRELEKNVRKRIIAHMGKQNLFSDKQFSRRKININPISSSIKQARIAVFRCSISASLISFRIHFINVITNIQKFVVLKFHYGRFLPRKRG